MNDTTVPKLRRPFRGRRPRRPGDPEMQLAAGGDAPPAEGEQGGRQESPVASFEGPPVAAMATGESPAAPTADAQQRGPRPDRQNRQGPGGRPGQQQRGRKQRNPNDPVAEGGEARGAVDPDAQPRFNDGPRPFDPNRGKGQGGGQGPQGGPAGRKARFERGQGAGAQGRGSQGRGGQGGPGGQGGQPQWGGKPSQPAYGGGYAGPERGNEARRNRGVGPQHQEPVRLSGLMCERGLCSPREADAYINRGWVIVNGERVTSVAARVHPAAEIRLAPEARGEQSRRVTILLNKPAQTSALATESGAASALTLIGADSLDVRYDGPSFHQSHLEALAPAGSLEDAATGMLVLTQDTRVLEQLGGAQAAVEIEYLVEFEADASDEQLAAIAVGEAPVGDAPVDAADAAARAAATPVAARVTREGDKGIRIIRSEGRESSLRRVCEAAGLKVRNIKRLRIGHVRLGDVPAGKWRYLRDDEGF